MLIGGHKFDDLPGPAAWLDRLAVELEYPLKSCRMIIIPRAYSGELSSETPSILY